MNHSMPGFPVHHQLPEFTQTYVHWVGDAIQPSHPLLSPFPPAPDPQAFSKYELLEVVNVEIVGRVFLRPEDSPLCFQRPQPT